MRIRDQMARLLSIVVDIILTETMKQIFLVLVAVAAVLTGLGFLLPALAKLRAFGYLAGPEVGFLLLGIIILLSGPATAVLAFRKRRL